MRIKIIFLSIITFLFFSLAQANSRDGFYAGVGIDWSGDQYELTTNYLATGITTIKNADDSHIIGNLFAGYGYVTSNAFFWGGEIGTTFPSRAVGTGSYPTLSFQGVNVSNTLSIQDYVTLDTLPGYAISPSLLLYGRIGITYSSLELTQPNSGIIAGFSSDETKWGGRFGIGASFAMNENLGIGLDYFYTLYQNLTTYVAPFNASYTVKPSSNFLGLSILYTL